MAELNWGKIKNGFKGFEDLAYTYVKEHYPNTTWKKTGETRDGNKDAVAVVIGYQSDIISEQKWWMEAKYSNEVVRLTRYRLDATIVSAILERNVTKIIIVTNIILKPKTISDLQKALSLATGYDDIKFACKYDLEYWLYNSPCQMELFFGSEFSALTLPELFVINKAEYYFYSTVSLAFKESMRLLQKNTIYCAYFSLYSNLEKNIRIRTNPALSGIKITSERKIMLNSGENRVKIYFKLADTFPGKRSKIYNSEPLFYVENEPILSEKLILVSESSDVPLIIEYQENILNKLKTNLTTFNKKPSFALYDIIGNSGSGKSFIINKLAQSKECGGNPMQYLEFTDSGLDNMAALVNLILFIHFPYLAPEDIDSNYLNQLKSDHYISACLKRLVESRNDFEEICKVFADIHSPYELFPVRLYINARIIVLDNVQKLNSQAQDFLFHFVYGLYLHKAPLFIIIAEQSVYRNDFVCKVHDKIPVKCYYCNLEPKEILKFLQEQRQFRIRLEGAIHFQMFFPNIIDFIMFVKYLNTLKSQIFNVNDFYLAYHSFINSELSSAYMLDQFNKLFLQDDALRGYCDKIYWAEDGYPETDLNEEAAAKIRILLEQNLVKYNLKGNIIPYHDIYKSFYHQHFKPRQIDSLYSDFDHPEMVHMSLVNPFFSSRIYECRDKLRGLITKQKFYTVNYILDELFQEKNCNLTKNRFGEELYYELFMLFAISNTNISKKISGKKLFEKLVNETRYSSSIRVIKVNEEATWEFINSLYDSLMYKEAISNIKVLMLTLTKLRTLGELSEDLTFYIRYHDVMVIKSLIESDMEHPYHYSFFIQRYRLMIHRGFKYRALTFIVRYSQTIMRSKPQIAIRLFKDSMEQLEKIKGVTDKYYLWSTFGYYFMLVTYHKDLAMLSQLVTVHEQFKINYFNDYRKRISGIALLYFLNGDLAVGNQYLLSDAYVEREMRPRQRGFYYEAVAFCEILQGNYDNTLKFLQSAAEIFSKIPGYLDIINHNIEVVSRNTFSRDAVEYTFGKSLQHNVYYLDPRCIW